MFFQNKAKLNQVRQWRDKLIDRINSFFIRLGVHIVALVLGAIIANSSGETYAQSGMIVISIYTGLICIVSPKMDFTPAWFWPFSLGVLQTIICLLLGLPFYFSLFWGGALSWLVRLIRAKGKIGLQWVTLALLLIVGTDYLYNQHGSPLVLLPVTLLMLLGWLAWPYYLSTINKIFHRPQTADSPLATPLLLLQQYQASLDLLADKKQTLPLSLQGYLSAIAKSGESILECMRQDSMDIEPGRRFMDRYLPAVHRVVDEHGRLVKGNIHTQEITNVLTMSQELLARLEQAFAGEHSHLLRNDADNFSAELKVLDTLLKMDGR